MNLELLDPFGRQVPDRVDATIQLPRPLHFFGGSAGNKGKLNNNITTSINNDQLEVFAENFFEDDATTGGGMATNVDDMKVESTTTVTDPVTSSHNDDNVKSKKRTLSSSSTSTIPKKSKKSGGTTEKITTTNVDKSKTTTTKPTTLKDSSATSGKEKKKDDTDDDDEKFMAAYDVSFNRRGTYLAIGHGSGTVAIYSVLTRTLVALYRNTTTTTTTTPTPTNLHDNNQQTNVSAEQVASSSSSSLSCSSVSWSRRSRTILAGSNGSCIVKLIDTTHPYGPEESCNGLVQLTAPQTTVGTTATSNTIGNSSSVPTTTNGTTTTTKQNSNDSHQASTKQSDFTDFNFDTNHNEILPDHTINQTKHTSFADPNPYNMIYVKETLRIGTVVVVVPKPSSSAATTETSTTDEGKEEEVNRNTLLKIPGQKGVRPIPMTTTRNENDNNYAKSSFTNTIKTKQYPIVAFSLPLPLQGSIQIHPRRPTCGLAVLSDGTLVIFYVHPSAWMTEVSTESSSNNAYPKTTTKAIPTISTDRNEVGPSELRLLGKRSTQTITATSNKDNDEKPSTYQTPKAIIVPLYCEQDPTTVTTTTTTTKSSQQHSSSYYITTAAFDPYGNKVYAGTKNGIVLGFDLTHVWNIVTNPVNVHQVKYLSIQEIAPVFTMNISGTSSSCRQIIVSKNGKFITINSTDGVLRLYHTNDLWPTPLPPPTTPTTPTVPDTTTTTNTSSNTVLHHHQKKPAQTYQDVVSKIKFVSCDVSGDNEYIVGGANDNGGSTSSSTAAGATSTTITGSSSTSSSAANGNKYQLYIWNTATGALMDQLTGPANVTLYSVAWHPTRPLIAIATSDGIVDIWGPRINWTAFAPDFQALPMNVEYIECEDEFDTVIDTNKANNNNDDEKNNKDGTTTIVVTDDDGVDPRCTTTTNTTTTNTSNSNYENSKIVDVMTIEHVPVFASDSENEEDVFVFETKVKNLISSSVGGMTTTTTTTTTT